MKKWVCLLTAMLASGVYAGGVPNQITYQGTLKESGVPVNGPRTLQFRLTNSNGTEVYWSSGNQSVAVAQGLFSAVLAPTGVDWQNIAPYMEVSVNGQLLLPREAVSSSAYAMTCGSVINETGMIAMFARDCPSGWTRFSAMDGRFPFGGPAYGPVGGSVTHGHALSIAGTIPGGGASVVGTVRGSNALSQFGGAGGFQVDIRSAETNAQSHMPPYLTVVYCQKQ